MTSSSVSPTTRVSGGRWPRTSSDWRMAPAFGTRYPSLSTRLRALLFTASGISGDLRTSS
eukprot:scaffold537_cov241-Pinguiococcus_pyrenoidosus.AAC.4